MSPRPVLGTDAAVVAVVAVWIGTALLLDAGAGLTGQRLLGAGTWLVLLQLLRAEDRPVRLQVAVVVVFATAVEVVFAGALGVYVYRLDNVPAFVPPGHGLVYLAAVALGRCVEGRSWAPVFVTTTVLVAGGWALWGVTLSPRPDALGAFWFGCLLLFVLRGRRPALYAGAFVVVSALELLGTSLGTWTWQPHDPTGWVSIGNPPSGIAGGYAWFDAAAVWVAPRLLRRAEQRRAVPDAGRAGAAQNQAGSASRVVVSRLSSSASDGPVLGSSQRKKKRPASRLPS